MTDATLIHKNGAFWRGEARLVVMTRGQYVDGAPTHKEVEQAEQEIITAVHAAPDMLEVLKQLLEAFNEYASDLNDIPADHAVAIMEAAIAKAVGAA